MDGGLSEAEQHRFLDMARNGNFAAVRRSVRVKPAFVNVQPCLRWSALHQAVVANDAETVRFLLIHGADLSLRTREGQTPFDVAGFEMSAILYSTIPSISEQHRFLDSAKKGRFDHVCATVATNPIFVHARPACRMSALFQALIRDDAQTCRFLLEIGGNAQLEEETSCGKTALDLAGGNCRKFLSNWNQTMSLQLTVSEKGASSISLEEQHLFLNKGKDGDWNGMRTMLEQQPALLNVQPSGRYSALHYAAKAGRMDVVRLLLARRANREAKNREGITPLAVAKTNCCTLLLSNRAYYKQPPTTLSHESVHTSVSSRFTGSPGDPGDPLRGVSLHYLAGDFMTELEASELSSKSTFHEIELDFIRMKGNGVECPRTHRLGAAFVDVLEGKENVGRATHMLSYSWNYEIGQVVESLSVWCQNKSKDPKSIMVWICCLCINQHRVSEARKEGQVVPFESFKETFETRVVSIGKVLACLDSWRSSEYTTRVWCVFELYKAITLEGCTLEILLPRREEDEFRKSLIESQHGLESVWRALSAINVEQAESSVSEDRDRILALIEAGPGFKPLNRAIIFHLHGWFASSSEGYLQQQLVAKTAGDRNDVLACARVAQLFERISYFKRGWNLIEVGHRIYNQLDDQDLVVGAFVSRIRGSLLRRLGALQAAQTCFEEAEFFHQASQIGPSEELAALMHDWGKLKGDFGAFSEELVCHNKAKDILGELSMLMSLQGAGIMRSIGVVHFQQRRFEEAEAFLNRAKILHEQTNTLTTPECAATLQSLGNTLSSKDPPCLEEALQAMLEALSISESLGLDKGYHGIKQLRAAATIYYKMGQIANANSLSARADSREEHHAKGKSLCREPTKSLAANTFDQGGT
eukprot:TRINITY_DN26106_c0_g1_i1.p1 TRINITY_DN26106_c0_g1~~TRINITY_DN26106_c0_g1_i1.p1  ORF type:complete len:872 (+),score=139.26 TRINITY_DN26106_c0_g1_i1:102-2717(+)